MESIDLRSDTVTLPTPAMWQAIAHAELGDDVYGEDPTVNRLEAMAAERLGKQAGLFVPSGTMGNLAAVLAHCNRGDEVILGDVSHTFLYEAGGMAALGGVHPRTIPNQPDGTFPLEVIEAAIRSDDAHFPITRLIILENTHNRCGGAALSVEYTQQVAKLARSRALKLHLDGARIFNAAVALGVEGRALAEPADSVTFCLSKALCAPVGSVLCGDEAFIHKARRARKQLGGGMRQAGVLAAAGIVALETMIDRLAEDHERARKLAQGLREVPGIEVENDPPSTNMVYLRFLPDAALDAEGLAEAMAKRDIKVHAVAQRRMRLVLHYWIDDSAVKQVVEAFGQALGGKS
ncbi:MAG: low-specificity L-threonine aldolase [Anaerolineales bacterium]|jgi:threonine aldolase